VTGYLEYLSIVLQVALVLAVGYGSWKARVRYYRWGMSLLLVGFILNAAEAIGGEFQLVEPVVQGWLWAAGNVFLLGGVLMLTLYRGRLGL